jgi:hypothetical protein
MKELTTSQKIEKSISELLLPCPFCNHKSGIIASSNLGVQAKCLNEDCGAMLPSWLDFEKGENVIEKLSLVIEYWNKRI